MTDKQPFRRGLVVVLLLVMIVTGVSAQRNTDLVQRALDDSTFTWTSFESEGVRIYAQPGSFADRHRAMLLRSVATVLNEVLDIIGEPEYDRMLNVFYLDSREQMERIVGSPVTGLANWSASGVFVVLNPQWRSFEKHEIAHVLTMELWGSPHETSRWMIEGIAVYCDGWCREYSVDEIAWHFLSRDELPPLQELFDDPRALGEIRGGFYSASVIGFIRHQYGVETVRSLWLEGPDKLTEVLGTDIHHIERQWKGYLESTVNKDVEVDLQVIEDSGCG